MRHIVKRRDPKAVQKEREEREARAAAAATQAQASAAAKSEAEVEVQAPVESTTEPEEEILVVGEEPVVLSPEEMEYVPPAIEEEETIEA